MDGPVLILAHGAGAPMDSLVLSVLAAGLAELGVSVLRFEFPYMQRRRMDGKKRPPDRMPVLKAYFEQLLAEVREDVGVERSLYIGGKSMGGRVASHLGCDPQVTNQIDGVVCFGYPFHPPGKPERWRTEHFPDLKRPMFVAQGTRDPFGKHDEVVSALDSTLPIQLHWLKGGDHDFKPLKRQSESQNDLIKAAITASAAFMMAGRS